MWLPTVMLPSSTGHSGPVFTSKMDWCTVSGRRLLETPPYGNCYCRKGSKKCYASCTTRLHLGTWASLNPCRVQERYYWAGCHQDVQQWCKSCDICAMRKGPPKAVRAPMAQHNVGSPMERIAVDVLGPLPESEQGNKYLLIIAD